MFCSLFLRIFLEQVKGGRGLPRYYGIRNSHLFARNLAMWNDPGLSSPVLVSCYIWPNHTHRAPTGNVLVFFRDWRQSFGPYVLVGESDAVGLSPTPDHYTRLYCLCLRDISSVCSLRIRQDDVLWKDQRNLHEVSCAELGNVFLNYDAYRNEVFEKYCRPDQISESVGKLRVLLVHDVNGEVLIGWCKCVVLTVWGCFTGRETR